VAPAGPEGPAGPVQLCGDSGCVVAHPAANAATTASISGRFTKFFNSIECLMFIPQLLVTVH
jgi:hypothetical protein